MSTTLVDAGRREPPFDPPGLAAWVASWFTPASAMVYDEPLPTRASLLQRLKNPADQVME